MPTRPSAPVRESAANLREGEGVDSDRELIMEDARSIREGLWRIARGHLPLNL